MLTLGLVSASVSGLIVITNLLFLWLLLHGVLLLRLGHTRVGVILVLAALLFGPIVGLVVVASLAMYELVSYGAFYGLPYALGSAIELGPGRWSVWVIAILILWGVSLAYRLWLHRTLAVELSPDEFDPARAPAVGSSYQERLRYVEDAQRGNLTVYAEDSGARPFIGFGQVTQQWSLTTPLQVRSSREAAGSSSAEPMLRNSRSEPLPDSSLSVDELYDSVRSGLAALADPNLPDDQRVANLSIRDRVFLAGRLPQGSPYLEGDRPRPRLTDTELKHLESGVRGRTRHYQTVRMSAWGGELDVTVFLYITVRGGMLYAEFVATVLPGLHSAYRSIDTYDRLDVRTVMRAAARAVADVIRSPGAIVRLVSAVGHTVGRALKTRGEGERIRRQLQFDYGCRTSVRELGTDFDQPARFQIYDANERTDIVARRFLQILITVLDSYGYSTADLNGQATTVINNNTRIDNSNTFLNSTVNSSPVIAGTSASVVSAPAAPSVPPAGSGQMKGSQA